MLAVGRFGDAEHLVQAGGVDTLTQGASGGASGVHSAPPPNRPLKQHID